MSRCFLYFCYSFIEEINFFILLFFTGHFSYCHEEVKGFLAPIFMIYSFYFLGSNDFYTAGTAYTLTHIHVYVRKKR